MVILKTLYINNKTITKKKISFQQVNDNTTSADADNVLAFLGRHWLAAWSKHLGLNNENITASHGDFITDFLRQNCSTIFYAQDESSKSTIGSIVCQQWRGPVPIDVIHRDVLSIGTLWGFCVASEYLQDDEIFVRRVLLQQALQHLRDVLHCHKVVVLALSESETRTYRECGFQPKNMLTLSLSLDGVCSEINDGDATSIVIGTDHRVRIRREGPEADTIVVDHWKKMWLDVGIPESGIMGSMKNVTLDFIAKARENLQYQTFVARDDSTGRVLGSTSCQIWEGPCPQQVGIQRMGTIWAVYVHPEARRKGIASALMKLKLQYLAEIGCTHAILIAASEAGQRVYERLGFAPNNALVLDFSSGDDYASTSSMDCSATALNGILANQLQAVGLLNLSTSVVNALVTATVQQLGAVFEDHPMRKQIIDTVVTFQSDHNLYIDPKDNWFTQNIQKFGRGFDINRLRSSESALASKFDRLAERYDHWTVGNRSKVEGFVVSCAKNLLLGDTKGSGCRVLDVACGIGLQGQTLRMCGFEGELVGNDVSPGMIARAVQRGCYNRTFVGNVNHGFTKHPVSVDEFDVVICTGAMELLDQTVALRHISMVMKTGGEAWLSFQLDNEEAGVESDSTRHQNVSGIKKTKIEKLLSEAGLVALRTETCPDAFYTPSPKQDGSLLPVPYLFVVAQKKRTKTSLKE